MSTRISLAMSFHRGDYESQAIPMLKWLAEITPPSQFRNFLFVIPKHLGDRPEREIRELLKGWELYFTNPWNDPSGWPQGPNAMFDFAARWIHEHPTFCEQAWLWLEPDSIPLKAYWIEQIEKEYFLGGKLFMGSKIPLAQSPVGAIMNGVAVYPKELAKWAPKYFNNINVAFDVNGSEQAVPFMHDCKAIQSVWRPERITMEYFETRIDKEAALFHQCKDGSLIECLRAKRLQITNSSVARKPSKAKKVKR